MSIKRNMSKFEEIQNKLWDIIEEDYDNLYLWTYIIAPDHVYTIVDWCEQIENCCKIEDEGNKLARGQAIGVIKHAMCWALEVKVKRLANYIASDVNKTKFFL
jgi:hypothetical protein